MKSLATRIPFIALAFVTSLAIACASAPPGRTSTRVRQPVRTAPIGSGFLEHYDDLEPDPTSKGRFWFERPGFDWRNYHRVAIDPISIHLEPNRQEINDRQVRALTDYFADAVRNELGDAYPLTQSSGPDVLRIRAAVTDLEPARPLLNLLTALAVPMRFDVGRASIEVELLDSVTGERLAAMMDTKRGSKLKVWQGFSRWSDTRGAFRAWARELRVALETNP